MTSQWSWRGVFRALFIAMIAWSIGAGAGYGITARPGGQTRDDANRTQTVSAPPTASAAELALLAPLRPGAELEGWTVVAIDPVASGSLRMHLSRDGHRVDLDVAAMGPSSPPAPATAGPYGVYYAIHTEADRASLSRVAVSLAQALARVVAQNASVPTPPGMTDPFFRSQR